MEGIYSYYGIKAHIQPRQCHYEKLMGRRPFVGLWREEIVRFFGYSEGLNSRLAYERLNDRFWLPNSLLTWHLSLPEVNCGLLMRKCTNREGSHWTSQLGVRMETSGLPVCIGMYPFDKCTTLSEKQSIFDVFHVG